MNDNILSTSGKALQKFISNLTEKLSGPKAKFITDLLCGIIFSDDLILTHVASKVIVYGQNPCKNGSSRERRRLIIGNFVGKMNWNC